MSEADGGEVESCSRNGRLARGEAEVRRIWKEYFEDFYNIDTQEQVAVHMCGLNGVWRGNYLGREPIRRSEVEVRVVGKLKMKMLHIRMRSREI